MKKALVIVLVVLWLVTLCGWGFLTLLRKATGKWNHTKKIERGLRRPLLEAVRALTHLLQQADDKAINLVVLEVHDVLENAVRRILGCWSRDAKITRNYQVHS